MQRERATEAVAEAMRRLKIDEWIVQRLSMSRGSALYALPMVCSIP